MPSAVLADTDSRSRVKQFLVFSDVQELIPAKTVSSLVVKASVPDLLEVGMRCLKVR